MVEGSENYDSDSWGVELIDEIPGKFTNVSGEMAENHSGDHEKHLLIGSMRPKIAKEVSKNMVTKKVVWSGSTQKDTKMITNLPATLLLCLLGAKSAKLKVMVQRL